LHTLLTEQLGQDDNAGAQPTTPPEEKPTDTQVANSSGEQSSTETEGKTNEPTRQTPLSHSTDSGEHDRHTPSISLEYAPIGGEPHVQVLQDSLDGPQGMNQNYSQLSAPPVYRYSDERFSTTSSTVGGRGDDGDASTQHGADRGDQQSEGSGQLGQHEMLASMHLLSNPQFFNHMMMPPYNPMQWTATSNDVQMDLQGSQQQSEMHGLIHDPHHDQGYPSGAPQQQAPQQQPPQPPLIPYSRNQYPPTADFRHGSQ